MYLAYGASTYISVDQAKHSVGCVVNILPFIFTFSGPFPRKSTWDWVNLGAEIIPPPPPPTYALMCNQTNGNVSAGTSAGHYAASDPIIWIQTITQVIQKLGI